MELKEIRRLVREMRKLGIKTLSSPDLSLTLSDVAPSPKQRKWQGKEQEFEGNLDPTLAPSWENPLSEEQKQHQALFWSSAGVDE